MSQYSVEMQENAGKIHTVHAWIKLMKDILKPFICSHHFFPCMPVCQDNPHRQIHDIIKAVSNLHVNNPKIDNFACFGINCRNCDVCSTVTWRITLSINSKFQNMTIFLDFLNLLGFIFSPCSIDFKKYKLFAMLIKKWFSVEFLDSTDMKTCVTLWNQYQRIQLLQL